MRRDWTKYLEDDETKRKVKEALRKSIAEEALNSVAHVFAPRWDHTRAYLDLTYPTGNEEVDLSLVSNFSRPQLTLYRGMTLNMLFDVHGNILWRGAVPNAVELLKVLEINLEEIKSDASPNPKQQRFLESTATNGNTFREELLSLRSR